MTDAVADGGAPAPAGVSGAAIPDQAAAPGNAISYAGPEVEKAAEPERPSASIEEAIRKANAKVAAKNAEPKPAKEPAKVQVKPEAKPEAKPEPVKEPQPRDNGRFAAKPAAADAAAVTDKPSTAPKWLPQERAAKWDALDEDIRADITGHHDRREREFAQGIEKYRTGAERDSTLDEYHRLAESQGTTVQKALSNYIGIEQHLRKDLLGGLEQIVSNYAGKMSDGRTITLRDIAAHIMGQTPEQNATRQDSTISELRNELATLKQQLGGVTQTIQQQHHDSTIAQVQAFAKDHPRFDELADAIQQEIAHGYTLEEAYSRAERLNPAAQKANSEPPVIPAKVETPSLNPAGSKSISGAPSSGSNPVIPDNSPVPSIEEALKRALKRAAA